MKSGFYSFELIMQGIQDETGISNIRNRTDEIKRLVRRAEQEINPYSGFLSKKKMIVYKGNGSFDGKKIKKPTDFVSLHKLENCCKNCSHYETVNHILLCGEEQESVTYIYWALRFDSNGNPVIPVNHGEAVIAFIVWKFFSQKAFSGEGSHNVRKDYKNEFEERAHEARGEDMFPDEESLLSMFQTSNISKHELIQNSFEDLCISETCLYTFDENETPISNNLKIYLYQFKDPSKNISNINEITDELLSEQSEEIIYNSFLEGIDLTLYFVGRFAIVFNQMIKNEHSILDIYNNDITEIFDYIYDQQRKLEFLVTKEHYIPSKFSLKLMKK